MEADADGFRSEKMEGDRKFQRGIAIGFKICLRKTKERKTKGIFKKFVLIIVGSEAAFFKNAA